MVTCGVVEPEGVVEECVVVVLHHSKPGTLLQKTRFGHEVASYSFLSAEPSSKMRRL